MQPTLGGGRHGVLEKGFGRPPGRRAELVDQMRLVVVAGLAGNPGPVPPRCVLGELARTLEAQQPGGPLGREADLVAEAGDDPLAAPPELARQLADPGGSVRLDQSVPRPGHFRWGPPCEASREDLVEEPEALLPALRVLQSLDQERLLEHILERDLPLGELEQR